MSKAAYGTWVSPISSQLITQNCVGLQQVSSDLDPQYTDNVYWIETRPDEKGRKALCCYNRKTKKTTTVTPKDFNVRSTVHEYGGKSYLVFQGTIYFSNYSDQVLYMQKTAEDNPVALTEKDKCWRYVDFFYSSKKERIYCVREDHSQGKEAVNTIISISPSSGQQVVLVSDADFYSDARVSPDGKHICWIEWKHPNMPWDSTSLYVADLTESGDGLVQDSVKKIETGEDNSVIEPKWTNNNHLYYISDQSNWWNLYSITESGQSVNMLKRDQELSGPKWELNGSAYALDPKGGENIMTLYGGLLEILNSKTGITEEINTGFENHREIMWSSTEELFCLAFSATQFMCVIQIDLQSKEVTTIKESQTLSIEPGYFSLPEAITWQTEDKQQSHGYYYPPQNKNYTGLDGELPPLLVRAHGGPTSCFSKMLDLKLQYFTSRGFAVLLVNYRGSTGYGKQYRHSLKSKWGVLDIDDCCSGALYLANGGKVDKNKLCIDGGSAGGYTTLACLTFKEVFKAGASHYGIGDIESLAEETHKFESRYMETLIAPCTEEGRKILKERSPINYVDKINCAMAFFQGDEDKIVPPNQARMMYEAVLAKGMPTVLVMFEGEQHGFRKAQNIQNALDGEYYFFSRVLGFTAADSSYTMKISNLD